MEKELRFRRNSVMCEKPSFPKNMLMELANVCNHRCVFCHYKNMSRKKKLCDRNVMYKIMEEAYENGTREIGFYLMGEPLIKNDLEAYIAKAKGVGYEYIYLTSNGALADLRRMKKLVGAGLNSIKFSINAASRETYKIIHGKDDFDVVKENVTNLGRYVKENGIKLSMFISFVTTNLTKGDELKLTEIFAEYVDKIYVYDCLNQGIPMKDLVDRGIVDEIKGGIMPCVGVFNTLHVTCEGYLNACCADADGLMAVADLHNTSLVEAWNCEKMVELRKQFITGKFKKNMCFTCINNVDIPIEPLNPELYYNDFQVTRK